MTITNDLSRIDLHNSIITIHSMPEDGFIIQIDWVVLENLKEKSIMIPIVTGFSILTLENLVIEETKSEEVGLFNTHHLVTKQNFTQKDTILELSSKTKEDRFKIRFDHTRACLFFNKFNTLIEWYNNQLNIEVGKIVNQTSVHDHLFDTEIKYPPIETNEPKVETSGLILQNA